MCVDDVFSYGSNYKNKLLKTHPPYVALIWALPTSKLNLTIGWDWEFALSTGSKWVLQGLWFQVSDFKLECESCEKSSEGSSSLSLELLIFKPLSQSNTHYSFAIIEGCMTKCKSFVKQICWYWLIGIPQYPITLHNKLGVLCGTHLL